MSAPKAFSGKQAELALEILRLAEVSFETGDEQPGDEPNAAILREALRAAKDDLNLLAAAQRQLESADVAADAFRRAESRIDLALALYEFRVSAADRTGGGAS